jgi:signal transduction histidine kinase
MMTLNWARSNRFGGPNRLGASYNNRPDLWEVAIMDSEQRDKTERVEESYLQVHVNKCRCGVRRFKETWVRTIRIITLSLRPERWQQKISDVEWLSTSIVHDLRNPLAAIYTAAELLIELDPGPTQVKRLANNIYRAAGRMRELLADLNSVARRDRPMLETCDIREVIATASDAASVITEDHNVQILLEVTEGIKLPLIRSHIERVFFNLIANSVEAMMTGGTLRIAARKTVDYALIELEDTGPGIPRAIRDRLFEPFMTAGKQDGLGLGLALSRQTLLHHGGDIWTEPAIGARFVIRLPLHSR